MLPETQFLVQYLRDLQVGDVADYETLSEKAGVSVIDRRHILTRAIEVAARDHQVVLENLTGIGYKRIEASDAPETLAKRCTNRIRGQTKRWRDGVNNSGQAITPAGGKSLSQCAFVEFAVDSEVQKTIALNNRHEQAIDMSDRKKKLLELLA